MFSAAMIAGTFRLDPVLVLQSDYFDWKVRAEAANLYNEEVRKQQEAANKNN